MASPLFPSLPEKPESAGAEPAQAGAARLERPERRAVRLRPLALDSLVPADHQVRVVWRYVERLDVTALEQAVRSVEGRAGRAAKDPRLLLAIWLFATLDGVGSAREIERLCTEHLAYLWLCGDVQVGRTVLAEFRVSHEAFLDGLLTRSVANLRERGLVSLERVSQDGLRVRASAGAGSFRRRHRLDAALAEARTQVTRLKAELEGDPSLPDARKKAAQLSGAASREKRLAEALEQMPEIEKAWSRNQRKRGKEKSAQAEQDSGDDGDGSSSPPASSSPAGDGGAAPAGEAPPTSRSAPRASSTDPDARVMKMGDGGFRPALNCQLATDVDTWVVVAVATGNVGSDAGLHEPFVRNVRERYAVTPREWLVDGGFPTLATVESMPDGCEIIAPVPPTKDPDRNPHVPLPRDTPLVAAWRTRMGTEKAKETYRLRAATAECVNAQVRNRGLYQFQVRGRRRANCVLLLHALAHNLKRAEALQRRSTV